MTIVRWYHQCYKLLYHHYLLYIKSILMMTYLLNIQFADHNHHPFGEEYQNYIKYLFANFRLHRYKNPYNILHICLQSWLPHNPPWVWILSLVCSSYLKFKVSFLNHTKVTFHGWRTSIEQSGLTHFESSIIADRFDLRFWCQHILILLDYPYFLIPPQYLLLCSLYTLFQNLFLLFLIHQ